MLLEGYLGSTDSVPAYMDGHVVIVLKLSMLISEKSHKRPSLFRNYSICGFPLLVAKVSFFNKKHSNNTSLEEKGKRKEILHPSEEVRNHERGMGQNCWERVSIMSKTVFF